ncbi:MAG TPA: condensation domain-containing protein, partial [Nostocaceae cyanobacterium]|nr:condensation domain-containing protein [Nostocaceae cyanobacterium]
MQALTIEGFRLSPQQEHLWSLQQVEQSVYQSNCIISITGNIDIKRLELALQNIVNRHEILRTCFRCLPGMTIPVQVITNIQVNLDNAYNLSNFAAEEQKVKTETILQKLKSLPFDLEKGSVLQVALVTLSLEQHLLYISLPAICSDTITLHNLMRELASLYSSNLDHELSDDALQYADFSEWQNQIIEGEETEVGRKFWLQRNLSVLDRLNLPYEIDTAKESQFLPNFINSSIDAKLAEKAEHLVQKLNSSSSIFFLTCWQILLWKLLKQPEIIIGVSVNGRKYDELKSALGLFAKYLPLHSHLEDNLTFSQVLQQVHESVEEIDKWQECFTWEQINYSGKKLTRLPFGFDFEKEAPVCYADDVKFSIEQQYSCIECCKIRLSCQQKTDIVNLEFHYDSNVFNIESIELLAEQFSQLIASVINNPEELISKLSIVSENAFNQLIYAFNQTQADYPQNKCIHHLFAEQVERTPNNTAVVYNNQQITYAQINARANQLAHYLQKLG